jgi:hypothetical protein
MNRAQPPTTRRETTYTDGGNADIAEEQKPAMRMMVVDRCPQFMSLTANGEAVKVSMRFWRIAVLL